jgi:hypothetical protein
MTQAREGYDMLVSARYRDTPTNIRVFFFILILIIAFVLFSSIALKNYAI